jgi:hypothetical protein
LLVYLSSLYEFALKGDEEPVDEDEAQVDEEMQDEEAGDLKT